VTRPLADTRDSDVGVGTRLEGASIVEPAGRFRCYLGAAPGVRKTYAVLNEGHRRKQRGTEVVVGFVECHGRPFTEQLVDGLEVVEHQVVEFQGRHCREMDLGAILKRHPDVVLVDELAHINVAGSERNQKRWQDVMDLLNAGINVITTVNIRHLEGMADAVEEFTNLPIRERVPDWVLRRADQIELVDSSPEQLRRRLLHGNICPTEQVPRELGGFFRRDNLIALREMALRFVADESDIKLLNTLRGYEPSNRFEASERILVAVTGAPGTEVIVHRASRMARRMKADLQVVHIVSGENIHAHSDGRLAALRQLAFDVGGEWNEYHADDAARGLVEFASTRNITQIVVGSSGPTRRREWFGGGSFARNVTRIAADAAIDIHIVARRAPGHSFDGRQ
jgi:two-component system sensor histidine kinase KdpD